MYILLIFKFTKTNNFHDYKACISFRETNMHCCNCSLEHNPNMHGIGFRMTSHKHTRHTLCQHPAMLPKKVTIFTAQYTAILHRCCPLSSSLPSPPLRPLHPLPHLVLAADLLLRLRKKVAVLTGQYPTHPSPLCPSYIPIAPSLSLSLHPFLAMLVADILLRLRKKVAVLTGQYPTQPSPLCPSYIPIAPSPLSLSLSLHPFLAMLVADILLRLRKKVPSLSVGFPLIPPNTDLPLFLSSSSSFPLCTPSSPLVLLIPCCGCARSSSSSLVSTRPSLITAAIYLPPLSLPFFCIPPSPSTMCNAVIMLLLNEVSIVRQYQPHPS